MTNSPESESNLRNKSQNQIQQEIGKNQGQVIGQMNGGVAVNNQGTVNIFNQPQAKNIPLSGEEKIRQRQNDDLQSTRGIDYSRLRDFLANGKWEKANEETQNLILRIGGGENKGYLDPEDIMSMSCADLKTIDRLWVNYTYGHFGFSVQKKIYVKCGGKLDGENYPKVYEKFGEEIGWFSNGRWNDPTFDDFKSILDIPTGHLPSVGWWGKNWFGKWVGSGGWVLYSRIRKCEF
jgi:hypothetical protein